MVPFIFAAFLLASFSCHVLSNSYESNCSFDDPLSFDEIGRGGHSIVYRISTETADFALKLATNGKEEHLRNEKRLLDFLQHNLSQDEKHFFLMPVPNQDVLEHEGSMCRRLRDGVLFPLLPSGDLENLLMYMRRKPEGFDRLSIRLALDIALALKALSRVGVVHGDLKASNIMLKGSGPSLRAVLADFGGSALSSAGYKALSIGTEAHIAPERLQMCKRQTKKYMHSIDVYAFGTILLQLIRGRLYALPDTIVRLQSSTDPSIHPLVRRCWSSEPSQRPTPQELVDELSLRMQSDDPWSHNNPVRRGCTDLKHFLTYRFHPTESCRPSISLSLQDSFTGHRRWLRCLGRSPFKKNRRVPVH
jgi:serine/threonine protein kinase